MKQCYNYKHIFDQPIKIRRLSKYIVLPFAIPITKIIVMGLVLFVLAVFFRGVISFLNALLPGLQYVIYLGVPYFLSGALMKLNPDGQKLHVFVADLILFLLTIYLPKKRYCRDEVVSIPKKVLFDEYKG